jgi:transposase
MLQELLIMLLQINMIIGENKLMKTHSVNALRGLKKNLEVLEAKINSLIKSDEALKKQYKIITSVDGDGPITAINMIVVTNEFKDISEAKKFACYSGVVPFQYTSGTSVNSKSKVSKMANHQMKTLLHMAALSSLRIKGEMQDFFNRKIEQGKNKMSVINAIRNKIVLRT